MNLPLTLLMAAIFTTATHAADVPFYLGTYTDSGKSHGIYLGHLDTDTGRLGPLQLAAEAKSPSYVALSPDGKMLYAAIEDGAGFASAFAVQADGKLKALNTVPAGGEGTCHISTDSTGRTVFVANYNAGNIAAFRTQPDGSLGERSALVQFEGTGPMADRQEKSHAHSIYTDPTNRFVYACDLGSDHVWIFHFDAEKGTLSPAKPPFGQLPPGSGPRHLAFHGSGDLVYVDDEMSLTVTTFARDAATGALTPLDTLPTVPPGVDRTGTTVAEIVLHPSGQWLYVSNRGLDTIAQFAVAADGRLKFVESASAHVKVPRGFATDPTGKWLIAGGQGDDHLAVLRIDPATGKLTPTDQSAEVGAPVCVLFAPAR